MVGAEPSRKEAGTRAEPLDMNNASIRHTNGLYMAFNHNGIELMLQPTDYATAKAEADEYYYHTLNESYVKKVVE